MFESFKDYSAAIKCFYAEEPELFHMEDTASLSQEKGRALIVDMFCAGDYEAEGIVRLLPIALSVFERAEPDDEMVSTIGLYANSINKHLWENESNDREMYRLTLRDIFAGKKNDLLVLMDRLALKYLPADDCGSALVGIGTLKMLFHNLLPDDPQEFKEISVVSWRELEDLHESLYKDNWELQIPKVDELDLKAYCLNYLKLQDSESSDCLKLATSILLTSLLRQNKVEEALSYVALQTRLLAGFEKSEAFQAPLQGLEIMTRYLTERSGSTTDLTNS